MERNKKGQFAKGHGGYRWNLGKHLSEETKMKISKAHKGKMLTLAHREAIGAAARGKRFDADRMTRVPRGANHSSWKGDNIGYEGIHRWLGVTFGKANRCEGANCKGISDNYQYALRKGMPYARKRENFLMLCVSCHSSYDKTPSQPCHCGNKSLARGLCRAHYLRLWKTDSLPAKKSLCEKF